jgi:hypothetical protein
LQGISTFIGQLGTAIGSVSSVTLSIISAGASIAGQGGKKVEQNNKIGKQVGDNLDPLRKKTNPYFDKSKSPYSMYNMRTAGYEYWTLMEQLDYDAWRRIPKRLRLKANLSEDSQNLAKQLISSGKVGFDKAHESGVKDDATAYDNIHDVANGKKAKRSSYGTAPGGSVQLDKKLLKALVTLSEKYNFNISEFSGGSHSDGSSHYQGNTADINIINGKHININNPYFDQFIKDAKKLGLRFEMHPPQPGHDTHLHLKF